MSLEKGLFYICALWYPDLLTFISMTSLTRVTSACHINENKRRTIGLFAIDTIPAKRRREFVLTTICNKQGEIVEQKVSVGWFNNEENKMNLFSDLINKGNAEKCGKMRKTLIISYFLLNSSLYWISSVLSFPTSFALVHETTLPVFPVSFSFHIRFPSGVLP